MTDISNNSRSNTPQPDWFEKIVGSAHPIALAVAALLLLMPVIASEFVLSQIFCWTLILGMIGLSLMFLAGYGGMVSLSQMTTAAVAAYAVAILGSSSSSISAGLSVWVYVPIAVILAMVAGTLIGSIAVRTEGIYTVMITLAIATAFFYFTSQNQEVFNGSRGFNSITPPVLFGVDWSKSTAFYYATLVCAGLSLALVQYVSRSPFGLALQGVRDNPRRMAALGFNVTAHRILAYTFAAVIAGVAGILLVWFNRQISPGTAAVGPAIDILIVAVVGGLANPTGPFIGALIFVLLRTFALDIFALFGFNSMRFNLLVGLGFLIVVLFSPDGVLGLWKRWSHLLRPRGLKPYDKQEKVR